MIKITIYEFGLKKLSNEDLRSKTLYQFCIKNDIKIVFDIRNNTGNRYGGWDCNGKNLKWYLNQVGIEYKWFPDLGVPPKYRIDYETVKKYYNEIVIPTRQKYINYILKYAKKYNICLICIERNNKCHRFILKKYLENKL